VRSYSTAVNALHREAWEDAVVEGPASIERFRYARSEPFPGRSQRLAIAVHVALRGWR
jgi:hypothetical protein